MRTDLVSDALRMALRPRQLGADFALVQHTDQVLNLLKRPMDAR